MFDFGKVTEVSLGRGKHKSPEVGLCFMEMAAWFAGEEHSDRPQCSCPVLGAYGIGLNDKMPDDVRNTLLRPLVPLIVGTCDPGGEQKRAEFLAMWAVNKIVPIALQARCFEKYAMPCEKARDLNAACAAADAACAAADAAACAAYAAADAAADAAGAAAGAAACAAAGASARAAACAAACAADAAARAAAGADVWPVAVEGLRQAILIGKHEPFDSHIDWEARHEALRELVA